MPKFRKGTKWDLHPGSIDFESSILLRTIVTYVIHVTVTSMILSCYDERGRVNTEVCDEIKDEEKETNRKT